MACHESAEIGYVGEPIASKYSIMDSQYESQRKRLNPFSGFQSSEKVLPPVSTQGHSTRSNIAVASSWICRDLKYSRQVRTPQSRMALSIGETSENRARRPV